jgi:hypothetical protein
MRASDEDRARVADRLRDAAADGRLSVEELEERLERAHVARTDADLATLTDDLPASSAALGPPAAPRRELAVLGDVVLDLRGSRASVQEIQATSILGDVVILVDPGTRVELSGAAILGDREIEAGAASEHAPVLRLHAMAWLGDVVVRTTPRPGWLQRKVGRRSPPPPPPPPGLPGP